MHGLCGLSAALCIFWVFESVVGILRDWSRGTSRVNEHVTVAARFVLQVVRCRRGINLARVAMIGERNSCGTTASNARQRHVQKCEAVSRKEGGVSPPPGLCAFGAPQNSGASLWEIRSM